MSSSGEQALEFSVEEKMRRARISGTLRCIMETEGGWRPAWAPMCSQGYMSTESHMHLLPEAREMLPFQG